MRALVAPVQYRRQASQPLEDVAGPLVQGIAITPGAGPEKEIQIQKQGSNVLVTTLTQSMG